MNARRLTLTTTLATLCMLAGGLLLSGTSALAELTHFYTGNSFGPGGLGVGTFSSGNHLASVAVEQSTGDVYVYEVGSGEGSVYKFNSSGEPVNFSALGSNVINDVVKRQALESPLAQIAVSSAGPTEGDVYVASYGSNVHIYGPEGSPIGELKPQSGSESEICGVAVDPAGRVYTASYPGRVDEYTPVTAPATNSDYVSSLWGIGETCQIAVDSEGDVYAAAYEGPVRRYEASQFNTLEVPAIGTQITTGAEYTLAVDPAPSHDDLYVDTRNNVVQYDSTGKQLGVSGASGAGALGRSYGIAVNDASGEVYAGDGESGVVEIFGPAIAVAEVSTGAAANVQPTSATLEGTVNPGNVPVTACEFEYGTEASYGKSAQCSQTVPFSGEASVPVTAGLPDLEANTTYHYRLVARNANGPSYGADGTFTTPGPPIVEFESGEAAGQTSAILRAQINPGGVETTYHFEYGPSASYGTSVPVPDGTIAAGFAEEGVSVELTGLAVGATYHFRVVAVNADSGAPIDGPDQTVTTIPAAQVSEERVSDVAAESATLKAYINPLGNDTRYYFQYGTTSCAASPSSCAEAPSPPGIGIGSEEEYEEASAHIQGLAPGTTYYYRTVASNVLGIAYGVEETFRTQVGGGGELVLPDDRAWELVSPPTKDGATIESQVSSEAGLIESSEDGGAITYLANEPIGEAPANVSPNLDQILSTRGAGGWSSQDIQAPRSVVTGVAVGQGSEFRLFSPDLSLGLVQPLSASLLSSEASEGTIYLRDDASDRYVPLVTAANIPAGTKLNEKMFGNHNTFGGIPYDVKFVGASPDLSHVVFESSAALTSNAVENGATPSLYDWTGGQLRLVSVLPNGKPADVEGGGYAFLGGEEEQLETRVSNVRHAVSEDGSRIVWNSGPPQEAAGHHLYIRDVARGETVQVDAAQGAPEPADGEAVFRIASSDDSRVFFADGERLTADSTADGRGRENLYVFEVTSGGGEPLAGKLTDLTAGIQGSGSGIIGASEDGSYVYTTDGLVLHDTGTGWTRTQLEEVRDPVGSREEGHARVSPNGRYLAFESGNGIDLYDASTGRVACASCNPTGEESGGRLPGWTLNGLDKTFYQSRYLSDSGRLFFETGAALVPQDTNGQTDVYEYEPEGVGDCTSASETFSEGSDGCIGLISSGTSSEPSSFLDASESGDDVFFLTAGRLVSQDYDDAADVYDARVCSASSPCLTAPVAPPACTTADSCRAAPSQQPAIFGAPPSATFSGAGNIAAAVKPVAVTKQAKAKPLTSAQKLAKALKACKKVKQKRKRAVCEAQARKRYAPKSKAKKSKASRSLSGRARR